jgi:hypothetical protein
VTAGDGGVLHDRQALRVGRGAEAGGFSIFPRHAAQVAFQAADRSPSRGACLAGPTKALCPVFQESVPMTTETTTKKNVKDVSNGATCTIPFDQINEPGAYVCNWSGHLLRVPQDGVTPGRSPLLNIVGPQPLFVIKISDDPYVSITKARLLACNCDVNVNF